MSTKPKLDYLHKRKPIQRFQREHLGYVVYNTGSSGSAVVTPLYRDDVFVKLEGGHTVISGHSMGDKLNGYYLNDPEGNVLATIAANALQALKNRAWKPTNPTRPPILPAPAAATVKRSKKRSTT